VGIVTLDFVIRAGSLITNNPGTFKFISSVVNVIEESKKIQIWFAHILGSASIHRHQ
jgi:hypothetical protein